MSIETREEKIFKKEIAVFNQYKHFSESSNTQEQTEAALRDLTDKYKELLDQTRFLTWISGRLEKKLHRSNRELNERNNRLEKTLAELVEAKAGRNAFIVIYFIAIGLFVLEEFFVAPVITMFGDGLGLSIMFKLGIVLLLKGVESVIEDRIKKKPKLQTLDSPVKTFFDFGRASAS
jgi:predicted phage tail protein